jgi:hypothetical protein
MFVVAALIFALISARSNQSATLSRYTTRTGQQ